MENLAPLNVENERFLQQKKQLFSHLGVAKQTILDLLKEIEQDKSVGREQRYESDKTTIEILAAEIQKQNEPESIVDVQHKKEISLLQQKLATVGQDLALLQKKNSELNKQLAEMRQLQHAMLREFSMQLELKTDISTEEEKLKLIQFEALVKEHETKIEQLQAEKQQRHDRELIVVVPTEHILDEQERRHQKELGIVQQQLATVEQAFAQSQREISKLNTQLVEIRLLQNAMVHDISTELKRRQEISAKEKKDILLQHEAQRVSDESTIAKLEAEMSKMLSLQLQSSTQHDGLQSKTKQAKTGEHELLIAAMFQNDSLAIQLARIRSDRTDADRNGNYSLEILESPRKKLTDLVTTAAKRYSVMQSVVQVQAYCATQIAELLNMRQEFGHRTMSVDPSDNRNEADGWDASRNAKMQRIERVNEYRELQQSSATGKGPSRLQADRNLIPLV